MSRSDIGTLAAARQAYDQREWASAYTLLAEADTTQPLAAEDLERMAWAARWSGRYSDQFSAFERAEKLYTQAGDRRGAARMAIHIASVMFDQRKEAVSPGYFARASDLLANESDCPERALFAFQSSMFLMNQGDADGAQRFATEAREIAARVGDRDLEALAKLSAHRGRS